MKYLGVGYAASHSYSSCGGVVDFDCHGAGPTGGGGAGVRRGVLGAWGEVGGAARLTISGWGHHGLWRTCPSWLAI